MITSSHNPVKLAEKYVNEVAAEIAESGIAPRVRGFIATEDKPSIAYARATRQKFNDVGIEYDLQSVERLKLEEAIRVANEDDDVHGVFIYFPVFHNQQDDYLRNKVDFRKDIEAGSHYWTGKLYANDRLAVAGDPTKKALLPCTPLAIVKILTELGLYGDGEERPLSGKTVSIFNRSEVIGRPLAVMMSNDGARLYSFDINGVLEFLDAKPNECSIDRKSALDQSDIVITGVPSPSFELIRANEIKPNTVCINFSSFPNFDDDVATHTDIYVPRVGPMTVAMCMRNTLRLYKNFHA